MGLGCQKEWGERKDMGLLVMGRKEQKGNGYSGWGLGAAWV